MDAAGSADGTGTKVRYVGDYYKVMFEKGKTYDLLGIETAPFGKAYRVYSPAFEDDGLFPLSEFEIVEGEEDDAHDERQSQAAESSNVVASASLKTGSNLWGAQMVRYELEGADGDIKRYRYFVEEDNAHPGMVEFDEATRDVELTQVSDLDPYKRYAHHLVSALKGRPIPDSGVVMWY